MALPNFQLNSIVTPAQFNAFAGAYTRGVDEGGDQTIDNRFRIRDDWLSNDPTQLKNRYVAFETELKVTKGTGLTVNYTGGNPSLETGLKVTIAPGSVTVSDNTVNYVFVESSTGVVKVSTIIPSRWFPMAAVTAVAGQITNIDDLRERFKVSPRALAIATFGGGGYQGDSTASSEISLSGTQYYDNFTLTSTGKINTNWLYIKARRNITIDGLILVKAIASGAISVAGGLNAQQSFFTTGTGYGAAVGHNSVVGADPYPWQASQGLGSGGSRCYLSIFSSDSTAAFASINTGKGGNGGGAIFLEAGGEIVIRGSILADGEAGTAFTLTSANATTGVLYSGNSGGTGGTIYVSSLFKITITATATLSSKGGDSIGGISYNYSAPVNKVAGPGGASGGYIVFAAPALSVDPNAKVLVTGGAGGAIVGTNGTSLVAGSSPGPSFANYGGSPSIGLTPAVVGGAGKILTYPFSPI